MSAIGSKPEDICSQRVFRLLTQLRHRPVNDAWLSEGKNLVVEWVGLVHICLLARRRANSGYRNQISAQFLKINSGVRAAAADDSVQFVGAQFAHCQSPDVPGRAHSSP